MISLVSNFITRFNNAKKCVKQIKNGEWNKRINAIDGNVYTAHRDGYRLWLANGSFFCEIEEFNGEKCQPAFGLLFRHYVWFAAARSLKKKAEHSIKHRPIL